MAPVNDDRFVEVLVEATGEVTQVPREWIGNPVLGQGIEVTAAQRIYDEGGPVQLEAPTEKSTVPEIEEFAEKAGIDLGDATKKAQKLAAIEAALAQMPADPVTPAQPPSDVQLVAGDEQEAPKKAPPVDKPTPPAEVQLSHDVQESDAGPTPVDVPAAPSDVQLNGPVDDLPIIPAVREAVIAARAEADTTQDPDGTESSDETPANGDEEN